MKNLTAINVLLLILISSVSNAAELQDPYIDQLAPPNQILLEAAENGVNSFKESSQFKKEWEVTIDREKGTIETNWFPVHKGEVESKIQIAVWGSLYRIDVWHLTGWLRTPGKTRHSMWFERMLQNEIEKHYKQLNKSTLPDN